MHNHFEKCDGGDADIFEVMRVAFPGALIGYSFLFDDVVAVQSVSMRINEFDSILKLYEESVSAYCLAARSMLHTPSFL